MVSWLRYRSVENRSSAPGCLVPDPWKTWWPNHLQPPGTQTQRQETSSMTSLWEFEECPVVPPNDANTHLQPVVSLCNDFH